MKASIYILFFFTMISCLTRRPESPQTVSTPSPSFDELASEIKQSFREYQKEATQQNEQIASEMQTAIHNVEQASIQDISQALENMDTAQIQSDVQTAMTAANSGTNTNTNTNTDTTLKTVSQILSYGGGGLLIVLASANFIYGIKNKKQNETPQEKKTSTN